MKNSQKGFIVPVLIVIIALLVIGGGVYVYKNKKTEAPLNTGTPQTNTQTPSVVTNQTILNILVTDWKKIGPNILPGFPAVSQAFYGYPDIIKFIGNNRIVISYQDDFNPFFAVLSYDANQKQFSYLDGLRSSPFKVTETIWNTWRKKYGDTSFAIQTYQFSSTRTGDVVYSSDWKLTTKNPFISSNVSNKTNLSTQQIESAQIPFNKRNVQLSNGSSEDISILAPANKSKWIVFGDINGDGNGDAVAVMAVYCGGAGSCGTDLAAWINQSGVPKFVYSISIGHRPTINSIYIHDQIISMDMYPSDTSDPQYPNQPRKTTNYKLSDDQLIEVK